MAKTVGKAKDVKSKKTQKDTKVKAKAKDKKTKEPKKTKVDQEKANSKKRKIEVKPDKKDEKVKKSKADEVAKSKTPTEAMPKPAPRPPALRVHGKRTPADSASSTTAATPTPSPRRVLFDDGVASPVLSPDDLKDLKKEAKSHGMSLEKYMEKLSAEHLEQNLDSHMRAVAMEEEKKKEDAKKKDEAKEKDEDEDEEEESSDSDSSSSEEEEEGGNEIEEEEEDPSDEEEDEDEDEDEDEAEDEEEEDEELAEAVDTHLDQQKAEKGGKNQQGTAETSTATDLAKAVEQQKAAQGNGQAGEATSGFEGANSVTHKPQWDKFARQCLDRKKFPSGLASHYIKDKVDLFRQWLQHGGDWAKFLDLCLTQSALFITLYNQS